MLNSPKTRAGVGTYTATYPVAIQVLGISTGTYNLRYVFQATSISTAKNLECTGWFSGFAGFWNVSTSTSSYISGSTGTCRATHRMSDVYQGSFVTANKEQLLSYAGTYRVNAYVKNI